MSWMRRTTAPRSPRLTAVAELKVTDSDDPWMTSDDVLHGSQPWPN